MDQTGFYEVISDGYGGIYNLSFIDILQEKEFREVQKIADSISKRYPNHQVKVEFVVKGRRK